MKRLLGPVAGARVGGRWRDPTAADFRDEATARSAARREMRRFRAPLRAAAAIAGPTGLVGQAR
jgi:hypothetical protein